MADGVISPKDPPCENYLYAAERGHPDSIFEWRSRYWSFLLKLDPDRPSPTIQALPGPNVGPFHWENRRLRVPELRRLSGADILFGVGGTPEGVIIAAALECMGGELQGRLWPRNDDERDAAVVAGYDLTAVLHTDDRVRSDNCEAEALSARRSRGAGRSPKPQGAVARVSPGHRPF